MSAAEPTAKSIARRRRRFLLSSISAIFLLISSLIASLLWLCDLHNVQCDSQTELIDLKNILTLEAINILPEIWSYGHYLAVSGVVLQFLVILLHRKTRLSLDYTCLLFWTVIGWLHFIDSDDFIAVYLCLTNEDLFTLQFAGSTCLTLLIFSLSLLPRKRTRRRANLRNRLVNKNTKSAIRSLFSNNTSSLSYNSSEFSTPDRFLDKDDSISGYDKNSLLFSNGATPKISSSAISADKKFTSSPQNLNLTPPLSKNNLIKNGICHNLDSKLSLLSLGGSTANKKPLDTMSVWSHSNFSQAKSTFNDTSSLTNRKTGPFLTPSKFTNLKSGLTIGSSYSPSINSHGGVYSNYYPAPNAVDPWLNKSHDFDALSCFSASGSMKSCYQASSPLFRTMDNNGFCGYRGQFKQDIEDDAISVMSGVSNRSFRRLSPKNLAKKSTENEKNLTKKCLKPEFLCKLAIGFVLFFSLMTNLIILFYISNKKLLLQN